MKHWKEVISVGDYWYVDEETGEPRKFTATPDLIKHWHDAGNRMVAAGLSIPVPVEHQKEAKPLTKAERAAEQLRNNAGWVERYAIRPGDRLFALTNVEDEEIARKIPGSIRHTSPHIGSFTDGDGKKWDGVITHLALTSRPRITRQEPFPSIAAALSLAQPTQALPVYGALLSKAGLVKQGAQGLPTPFYPMAFSVWSGVSLAEEPEGKKPFSAKEGAKEAPKEKGEAPASRETPEEGVPDAPGLEHDDEMEMVDVLRELVCALWGVELPEDTDEKNLMQRLLRAMMDNLKAEGAVEPEEPEVPKKPDNPASPSGKAENPLMVEPQPMYMSLEQVQAITDPRERKMAEAMFSLQEQVKKSEAKVGGLAAHALSAGKAKRDQRIEGLVRRVGKPAFRDKLVAKSQAIALSLGDDGVVVDPMSDYLDLLEAAGHDLALSLKHPSVGEQPHPAEYGGEMSEERRQQIVDEQCRGTDLARRQKSA